MPRTITHPQALKPMRLPEVKKEARPWPLQFERTPVASGDTQSAVWA